MIVFGQRAAKIADVSKKVFDKGTQRDAHIIIFQKYGHIFWIPLFPMGRNFLLHFPDTNEVYEKTLFKKMPENYKEICREVSRESKTPLWMYIGLALFAAAVVYGYFANRH